MTNKISDFTVSETRTLALITLAMDDVEPESRDAVIEIIAKIVGLGEMAQTVVLDSVEALDSEPRAATLVAFFQSGRPLIQINDEVWSALDQADA